MVFAPQTSVIRDICSQVPSWIQRFPITPPTWSLELQKLEGHTDGVSAVAFSPYGSQLASASFDKTIRLWDPTTGQEVQKLEGHTNWVKAVAFSPDGSQLASASRDKTIRLWDPTTGQEVQKLEGHTKGVNAVAFSPDGSQLASASWDKTIRLWNPTTSQEVRKLEFENLISTLSFTNDNKVLLTNQGTIEIEQGSRLVLPPESSPNQTSIKHGNWIRQGSRDLLWLP